MDVWGLVLNGIGAVLIAAGQEIVAGVTTIWLGAHEAILRWARRRRRGYRFIAISCSQVGRTRGNQA